MSRSSVDGLRAALPFRVRAGSDAASRWATGIGRGQVEPLAALVAVAAVCIGLGIYAGALDTALTANHGRATVETVADNALRAVAPSGVATPTRLGDALDAAPDGYRLNATLLTGDRRWSVGPVPPTRHRTTDRPTGLRVAPGDVRPGTLRVALWR